MTHSSNPELWPEASTQPEWRKWAPRPDSLERRAELGARRFAPPECRRSRRAKRRGTLWLRYAKTSSSSDPRCYRCNYVAGFYRENSLLARVVRLVGFVSVITRGRPGPRACAGGNCVRAGRKKARRSNRKAGFLCHGCLESSAITCLEPGLDRGLGLGYLRGCRSFCLVER